MSVPAFVTHLHQAVQTPAFHRRLERALRAPKAKAYKNQAAVLVAIRGTTVADASVLLTHRSPVMRSHSWQVAFPGGRRDPGDASATAAALREAWEETALPAGDVTVLGELPELYIHVTGNPVVPVLAHWHGATTPTIASPTEVDEVFCANLRDLSDPAQRVTVQWGGWQGPAFWNNGYLIWGFTVGVLDGMLNVAGWEQPWDHVKRYDLEELLAQSRNSEMTTRRAREGRSTEWK